jgi:hypothetical protein
VTGIAAGKTWSRIGPEVAPTSAAASGVWTLNELAQNEGAGTWPAPLIGTYEWIGGFNFSSPSTSSVSFTSLQTNVYSEYVLRMFLSKLYITYPVVNLDNAAYNTVQRHSISQDGGQDYGWYGGSGSTIVPDVLQQIAYAPVTLITNMSNPSATNRRTGTATQAGAGWSQSGGGNVSQTQETGITYNPSANPISSIQVLDNNGRTFEAGTTINLFGIKIV